MILQSVNNTHLQCKYFYVPGFNFLSKVLILIDFLSSRLISFYELDSSTWEDSIRRILKDFNDNKRQTWDFYSSLFFCCTVFTTLGE